jgi:zinc protease
MSLWNSRHRRPLATVLALALASCVVPPTSSTGRSAALSKEAAEKPAPLTQAELENLPREAVMPLTPEVRSARLPNGFRYFIRRNSDPQGRAEFRFVINAGSLLEDEDQRGFAHFLEHMLFNGTERFPGMDVFAFLQSTGMQVGADANAYTNYDETVCVIKVPTDNPRIVPTALDVMLDWATAVTLDPDEVDAERGVIVEERRLRSLSASGRIQERLRDLYLAGSRYAVRPPIGQLEVIQKGSRDRLASFYRSWYRPENLAIVAVGDFDPLAVERMILERFAPLSNPPGPAPARPEDSFADKETLYAVLTDPEQPVTSVSLTWKRPAVTYTTVGSYQNYLIFQLFDRMLNFRLLELAESEGSPVLQAAAERGLYVRALELWNATALAPEGQAPKALEALLSEIERVRRYGFSAAELERAKRDVRTTYERAAAEEQHTSSGNLANELVRHVTTDEPVPGILAERAFTERFLPDITLEDMNREAARFTATNRIVVVVAPEKRGLAAPSEDALRKAVARVESSKIADYTEQLEGGALMAQAPAPAEITSRREIPELGVTELVLANGARVLYKPTRLKEREILFSATSPGGASLVSDEDYPEARLAGLVAAESGVGKYSRTALRKLMAGSDIAVAPSVDSYFEGMDGEARSEDLAALLQLVHLYFTSPRQDKAVAARLPRELISLTENRKSVPEFVLQQAVDEALYGKTVRAGTLQVKDLQRIDASRLFSIYRERFANARDFTFEFVGSFEPKELEKLVQQYIGTLPSKAGKESYRSRLRPAPREVVSRTLAKGKDDRSLVRLVFEGPLSEKPTPRTLMQAVLLEQALGEALQSELREARGAVYGVLTEVTIAEIPEATYRATIDFTTDPRRVDELVGVVFEEIDALRAKGPGPTTLAVSKEAERRKREEARGNNAFWLGVLDRWAKFPESDPRELLSYDAELAAVSAEEVRKLGEIVFQKDRYVKVVLQPEQAVGGEDRASKD